jgi:hypothetical protein
MIVATVLHVSPGIDTGPRVAAAVLPPLSFLTGSLAHVGKRALVLSLNVLCFLHEDQPQILSSNFENRSLL